MTRHGPRDFEPSRRGTPRPATATRGRFVVRDDVVVELAVVLGEVSNAGEEIPAECGMRERKGTRNW